MFHVPLGPRQAMHKTAAAAAAEFVASFLADVHRCQQQLKVHVPSVLAASAFPPGLSVSTMHVIRAGRMQED